MPIRQLIGIKQDNLIDNSVLDELIDNLSADALSGQADVQVGNGSHFSVGEMVIVYDGEDTFETATIQAIVGNVLTMNENLIHSYPLGSLIGKFLGVLDTGNGKYARALAPDLGDGSDGDFISSGSATWSSEKNFESVLIQAGHTITISANFEIKCRGTFQIEAGGKLNAKGRGHSGGGGGNYGSSGAGNGGGSVYQLKDTGHGGGGAGVASGTDAAGGGGGGYGSNGGSGGYSGSSSTRGIGGITYNNASIDDKSTAYLMGAGGGGGGSALSNSGSGGNGGGIIRISCKNFVMDGEIDCDGNNGSNGGTTSYKTAGGGGGAGGTIFIICLLGATIGTNLIHARGGTGGQGYYGSNFGYYAGGNGGNGRIRIEAGAISGTSSPTFATGYSSGAEGRTKYGWYFTQNIETENETINVNCYVEQNIVEKKNLSGVVSAEQADVEITDASQFEAGDRVLIRENEKLEIKTIDSIASNVLSMTENTKYSYTATAEIMRIDVQGIISLVDAGDDENLQDMEIKDVEMMDTDIYKFTFAKCIRNNEEEGVGMKLVGAVRLKGRNTGETVDVSINEVSWMWF